MKKIFCKLLPVALIVLTACSTLPEQNTKKQNAQRDFVFYNIVPFAAGKEKQTAQDLIEYQKRTGNSIVLYCLTLHPEGFPARKKADFMIESYRKLRKELEGSDVKLGVLLQSILGHWPRVDKEVEKWTRTVNIYGKVFRYCPFDPEFKKYIFYIAAELAKEKPVFFLGDDDIRSFSHDAECFCHLHVAEFNKRTGKNFTSEQMRKAVINCKPGDEIFKAFHQLQRDTVNGVAALIRAGLDSVDPTIPAGSSMSYKEARFNDQTARAFAAKGQAPVMRLINANYLEKDIKQKFPQVLNRTMAMRAAHKDIPHVLDESDTCPHTLYSRAAISMHAKICASIMAGLNGSKVWYVNCRKSSYVVPPEYTNVLEKFKNYYQVLAREVKNSEFTGLIQPCFSNFPTWHFTASSEFFVDPVGWSNVMCSVFGIPYHCAFELNKKGIYLLAGKNAVARFTDADLKQMLSGKLLVDGAAATALTERGFAQYLGVTAERKSFRYNREYYTDGRNVAVTRDGVIPFITQKSDKCEVMTNYYFAPFSASRECEKVSPATVFFKNSLGGYICTTGFHMGMHWLSIHNPARKAWMLAVLEKLNGERLPVVVAHEQNYSALTRKSKDGSILFTACNLNFEPVRNFAIRCAKKPESIKLLTPDGCWEEIDFKWDDGVATTSHRMDCYTFSAFKIK